MVRPQLALVAPQAFLEFLGRELERRLGFKGLTGRLQRNAAVQPDHAVRGEAGTGFLDRDVAGEAAVEIFVDRLADTALDAEAESVADFHMLSRYAQVHDKSDLLHSGSDWLEFIPVICGYKVSPADSTPKLGLFSVD